VNNDASESGFIPGSGRAGAPLAFVPELNGTAGGPQPKPGGGFNRAVVFDSGMSDRLAFSDRFLSVTWRPRRSADSMDGTANLPISGTRTSLPLDHVPLGKVNSAHTSPYSFYSDFFFSTAVLPICGFFMASISLWAISFRFYKLATLSSIDTFNPNFFLSMVFGRILTQQQFLLVNSTDLK
jgi:hypothetical protein